LGKGAQGINLLNLQSVAGILFPDCVMIRMGFLIQKGLYSDDGEFLVLLNRLVFSIPFWVFLAILADLFENFKSLKEASRPKSQSSGSSLLSERLISHEHEQNISNLQSENLTQNSHNLRKRANSVISQGILQDNI
jgi:hypothetical protein